MQSAPLAIAAIMAAASLTPGHAAESQPPELHAKVEVGVQWNVTAGSSRLTGHVRVIVEGPLEHPVHREYPGDRFIALGYWAQELRVHYRFVAKTFETDPTSDCHGLVFVHSSEEIFPVKPRGAGAGRDLFKLSKDDPALGDSYRFELVVEPAPARDVPVTYRKPGCAKSVRPLPIFQTFRVGASSRWVEGQTILGQRSWASIAPPWGDFAVRVDELTRGPLLFSPPEMGDRFQYTMKWSFGEADVDCHDPDAYFACAQAHRELLDGCIKLLREDYRQQGDWNLGDCDVDAAIDCAQAGPLAGEGSWDCYFSHCDWDPLMPAPRHSTLANQIQQCLQNYLKAVEDCSKYCR